MREVPGLGAVLEGEDLDAVREQARQKADELNRELGKVVKKGRRHDWAALNYITNGSQRLHWERFDEAQRQKYQNEGPDILLQRLASGSQDAGVKRQIIQLGKNLRQAFPNAFMQEAEPSQAESADAHGPVIPETQFFSKPTFVKPVEDRTMNTQPPGDLEATIRAIETQRYRTEAVIENALRQTEYGFDVKVEREGRYHLPVYKVSKRGRDLGEFRFQNVNNKGQEKTVLEFTSVQPGGKLERALQHSNMQTVENFVGLCAAGMAKTSELAESEEPLLKARSSGKEK